MSSRIIRQGRIRQRLTRINTNFHRLSVKLEMIICLGKSEDYCTA